MSTAPRAPRPRPTRPEPRPGFVAVGFVRGPHGLRGELKVNPLTDYPERFQPGAVLHAGERSYTVRSARMHQKTLLLQLEGIDTRNAAETLRDLLLEVAEADLPSLGEGEYYRYQLVGLEVFDMEDRRLGRIAEVLDTGANDVYVVLDAEGELLLPAIDTVIRGVDMAQRRMVVEVPRGLERKAVSKKRSPR